LSAARALLPLTVLLASCPKSASTDAPVVDISDTSPEAIERAVEGALDRKADPCQDFYQFACGGWLGSTTIPSDKSVWSRGFSTVMDKNQAVIREVLKSGGGDARLTSYWGACMDTAAIDAAGIAPLKPHLSAIAGITDATSLMKVIARLPMAGAFFDGGADADFKDPNLTVLHLSQGGIGLPERNYYFPEDDEGRKLLADYEAHVGRMLGMIGWDAALAPKVVALEKRLAQVSKPPEELRDPNALYHRLDREGLEKLTPKLPWSAWFGALDQPGLKAINVMTPDFFPAVEAIAVEGDWQAVKAYLAWHLVHGGSHALTTEVDQADFEFFGKRLMGQQEQPPRWKRCVESVDDAIGDLLGQAYVDKAFPGDSKDKALEMIKDIEAAFEQGLPKLEWMDDNTRKAALQKLRAITNKIGYPDNWEGYKGLTIGASFFDNAVAVELWKTDDQLGDVGQPVDKAKWYMTPPTVNAYYNPLNNEIVFPAGILQPPFFSAAYPTAMNYGAMGMIMGHEVTHGFDDEGRKFAYDGTLREWWDPAVAERFEERAQCVGKLYSTFEPLPGMPVNGELTMGENIADLGGIRLASRAYRTWLDENGGKDATYAGFTPQQLLFVSYAQSWCTLSKDEVVKVRLATDPHSPPKFRVNGPLSQLPAFANAFECAEGTPMHPKETCEVW
jgi:endothelin-converting enzyme/putative endopeptidase